MNGKSYVKKKDEIRVQPHSEEAEKAVLGSIIKDGTNIMEKVAGWIRTTDAFYSTLNGELWDAIVELYRSHKPIDMVTVVEKHKDMTGKSDAYYVSGLEESVPTTANAESYARMIWEKYIQRNIADSAYKVYQMSYQEYDKVNKQLDAHTQLISELQLLAPSKKREVEDIVNETLSAIEEGTNVIRYGLKQLDEPAGGMTRKEITVLGGRPGHGKTTLMINAVRTLIERGNRIVLFNREMSNVEMMKKIIVMESASLKYHDLRLKKEERNGLTSTIKVTAESIKNKYKNLTMYDDIRTLSESIREVNKLKPDVVFDDYIQLISVDNNKNDGRRFEIETIMQEYKWACKRNNCSAFLLSQLNRAIEMRADPLPRMSDYSESGVIEQTAEAALFVWYGYQFDDSAYDKHESEIIAAKSRYGQVGRYSMGFNGDRCKFYETVEEAYKG
tara:strand:+ start:1254 stop:2588 length:1335 start_codon:yes stop_codon:yes gene_type:complete